VGTKTETLTFRVMQECDIAVITLLEKEAFHDAWNAGMLKDELANPLTTYIVMEQEQQIIGYAGFWLVAGEAQITRVAVFKNKRGQGLGNILTENIIEEAWKKEAEAVTLEVREHNLIAQKAYVRNGFKAAGIRPNYYEDTHEGAVIMWLYRE